jgi:hypothetical protein
MFERGDFVDTGAPVSNSELGSNDPEGVSYLRRSGRFETTRLSITVRKGPPVPEPKWRTSPLGLVGAARVQRPGSSRLIRRRVSGSRRCAAARARSRACRGATWSRVSG